MADFYEKTADAASYSSLKSLYEGGEHWDTGVSLKTLSQSSFTLRNFKVSDEGRLSSSKETHFISSGTTAAADCEALPAFADLAEEDNVYDYFGRQGGRTYCAVLSGAIAYCVFDKVRQELRFVFSTENAKTENAEGEDEDESAAGVPAVIPYSEINLRAVRFIEGLAGRGAFPPRWFICEHSRRGLLPLSMVTEKGVEDFYFN
jgi:hypothetical protein